MLPCECRPPTTMPVAMVMVRSERLSARMCRSNERARGIEPTAYPSSRRRWSPLGRCTAPGWPPFLVAGAAQGHLRPRLPPRHFGMSRLQAEQPAEEAAQADRPCSPKLLHLLGPVREAHGRRRHRGIVAPCLRFSPWGARLAGRRLCGRPALHLLADCQWCSRLSWPCPADRNKPTGPAV